MANSIFYMQFMTEVTLGLSDCWTFDVSISSAVVLVFWNETSRVSGGCETKRYVEWLVSYKIDQK